MAVMGDACQHSGRTQITAAFGSSQDFGLLPYSRLTVTPGRQGGKNYKVNGLMSALSESF
jgi:hypothetical protein